MPEHRADFFLPRCFENLFTLRTESSHFLECHGPMTCEEEQRQRALSGRMDAAGISEHPVDAGRWRRHRDLLDALEHVQTSWNAGTRPQGGVFRLKFNDMVGDGFAAGTQTPIATAHAMVIVRKGQIVTAFPVIEPNPTAVWEPVRSSLPPSQCQGDGH